MANKPLTVIARIKAKPGKEQDLKAALELLIPPTLEEEGCLNYDLHEGKDDPQLFVFYENWANKELHARHMRSPHLEDFKAKMDDLLAEPLQVDLVEAV